MKIELEFRKFWVIIFIIFLLYPIDRLLTKELVNWLPSYAIRFFDRYIYISIFLSGVAGTLAFSKSEAKLPETGTIMILGPRTVNVEEGRKATFYEPLRIWENALIEKALGELPQIKAKHPKAILVIKREAST